MLGEVDREIRPRLRGQRGRALPLRTVARVRDRAAGAIRVPRRSAFLLAPPGPYGPNGAAYAGSGSLWRRLESSLAYLSCFATLLPYYYHASTVLVPTLVRLSFPFPSFIISYTYDDYATVR